MLSWWVGEGIYGVSVGVGLDGGGGDVAVGGAAGLALVVDDAALGVLDGRPAGVKVPGSGWDKGTREEGRGTGSGKSPQAAWGWRGRARGRGARTRSPGCSRGSPATGCRGEKARGRGRREWDLDGDPVAALDALGTGGGLGAGLGRRLLLCSDNHALIDLPLHKRKGARCKKDIGGKLRTRDERVETNGTEDRWKGRMSGG